MKQLGSSLRSYFPTYTIDFLSENFLAEENLHCYHVSAPKVVYLADFMKWHFIRRSSAACSIITFNIIRRAYTNKNMAKTSLPTTPFSPVSASSKSSLVRCQPPYSFSSLSCAYILGRDFCESQRSNNAANGGANSTQLGAIVSACSYSYDIILAKEIGRALWTECERQCKQYELKKTIMKDNIPIEKDQK